jgi:hypothetical protein
MNRTNSAPENLVKTQPTTGTWMMRRLVKNLCALGLRRFHGRVLSAVAGCAVLVASATAQAQEIQLTGPLAGAPAVRKLRLHRQKRFEVSPGVAFTLLDEYQRTIMPGLGLTFHPTDWLGLGLWGGFGLSLPAGLSDEIQTKAIDARRCTANPSAKACALTAVNLTRKANGRTGQFADDQLAKMQWVVAPQITAIPFRGKLALFAQLFLDTDVNIFLGPAFVGLQERAPCGFDDDKKQLKPCSTSFSLEGRVAVAPTFGLGLNFYPVPVQWLGFGAEWRGLPFSWNTAGFDNHGGGPDEAFPDTAINSADREFRFNSMMIVYVKVAFPTKIKISE